jgi:Ribbon-helix-helix protein, copG family
MILRMPNLRISIDATLSHLLANLSQRERVSKSELVRRALLAYATERAAIAPRMSALEMAGDLVGGLSGAPIDLSSNTAHFSSFGIAPSKRLL